MTQSANTGHNSRSFPNIVEGTITDAVTGGKVQGVVVTIAGVSSTSDVNGFYKLIAVPFGDDQPLSAVSTGTPLYKGYSSTVNVTKGETVTIDFTMSQATYYGSLTGTVTDGNSGATGCRG